MDADDQANVASQLDLAAMQAELTALRSEVQSLRSELVARPTVPAATPIDAPVRTRRDVLRGLGLAAGATALGVAAMPGRAAATVVTGPGVQPPPIANDSLILGALNSTTMTTEVKFPGFPNEPFVYSHVFVANDGIWSTPRAPYAQISETGGKAAIAGFAGAVAMHGGYFQTNASVLGAAGVRAVGVKANAYGLAVAGARAPIRIERFPLTDPPTQRVDPHNEGEIYVDDNRDLWYCVEGGSPGTWLKLSGPTTAGQFHPIAPARVYDSRYTAAVDALATPIQPEASRLISVANAFTVDTPNTAITDVVPAGATAIAYNLSIAGTGPAGFLSLNPGDVTAITAASINWFQPGSVLGNASVVKLDGARQVKVFCRGSATDLIIDVVGYYR